MYSLYLTWLYSVWLCLWWTQVLLALISTISVRAFPPASYNDRYHKLHPLLVVHTLVRPPPVSSFVQAGEHARKSIAVCEYIYIYILALVQCTYKYTLDSLTHDLLIPFHLHNTINSPVASVYIYFTFCTRNACKFSGAKYYSVACTSSRDMFDWCCAKSFSNVVMCVVISRSFVYIYIYGEKYAQVFFFFLLILDISSSMNGLLIVSVINN